MLYFMCVEWNCQYYFIFFFICRILACSCVVCLCYHIQCGWVYARQWSSDMCTV